LALLALLVRRAVLDQPALLALLAHPAVLAPPVPLAHRVLLDLLGLLALLALRVRAAAARAY
jgi:hypothetical protein